ncbi:hypothetical protein GCM10009539_59670 [Cryptosporangium japonicum]|uniref:Uncharacterized protein n=1 Tax=Cryptosporangium japonicum TaxID=80872 RepID=A0ABN0UY03_9ACTN
MRVAVPYSPTARPEFGLTQSVAVPPAGLRYVMIARSSFRVLYTAHPKAESAWAGVAETSTPAAAAAEAVSLGRGSCSERFRWHARADAPHAGAVAYSTGWPSRVQK